MTLTIKRPQICLHLDELFGASAKGSWRKFTMNPSHKLSSTINQQWQQNHETELECWFPQPPSPFALMSRPGRRRCVRLKFTSKRQKYIKFNEKKTLFFSFSFLSRVLTVQSTDDKKRKFFPLSYLSCLYSSSGVRACILRRNARSCAGILFRDWEESYIVWFLNLSLKLDRTL